MYAIVPDDVFVLAVAIYVCNRGIAVRTAISDTGEGDWLAGQFVPIPAIEYDEIGFEHDHVNDAVPVHIAEGWPGVTDVVVARNTSDSVPRVLPFCRPVFVQNEDPDLSTGRVRIAMDGFEDDFRLTITVDIGDRGRDRVGRGWQEAVFAP